jgi:Concanavalin A-like lectin/glucanases superfamily
MLQLPSDLRRPSDLVMPAGYRALIMGTAGLVAYWRFGEPSGTVVNDEVGSTDGTYVNTPTLGVTGAIAGDSDTAVLLTKAQSEYIRIADAAPLDLGNGPMSFEFWFKKATASLTADLILFEKGTQHPAMYLEITSGKLRFYSANVSQSVASTAGISDTIWHHAVGTVTTGGTWLLYLDGADVTVFVAAPGAQASTAIDLFIGASSNPDTQFDGSVDEFAVYNVVLTPAQVLAHYNAGI